MKKLINVVMILCLFFAAPLIGEQVEELYWVGYASKKVEPAMKNENRVGTTFQVSYKDEQFTMTNLHICRIKFDEEIKRRIKILKEQIKNNKKLTLFPPLKDADLIGQHIKVGEYRRKILAVDDNHDLCLLEANPNLPSFSLASGYRKGELVRVIGFPRGLDKTLRKGRIFGEGSGWMPWLPNPIVNYKHISTLAYPGNSGSPVIDKYGYLVGVLFAGRSGIHTEALIVPLEDVRNFLHKVIWLNKK